MIDFGIENLLQISWKNDIILRNEFRKLSNNCIHLMVIIINIFWFNYSIILMIINILLLNRWTYFIKSVYDR